MEFRECHSAQEVFELYREVQGRMKSLRAPPAKLKPIVIVPPCDEPKPAQPPKPYFWAPMTQTQRIVRAIGKLLGIDPHAITSERRNQKLVQARAIAMYLTREMTGQSTTVIGNLFGRRDHTTVLNSLRLAERMLGESRVLKAMIDRLLTELRIERAQRTRGRL